MCVNVVVVDTVAAARGNHEDLDVVVAMVEKPKQSSGLLGLGV